MAEPTTCRRCGSSTTLGAIEELCPCCLGSVALDVKPAGGETLAISMSDVVLTDSASAPSVASPPAPQLTRFGDYELIEEIARGGMGVVYKARQLLLNRLVAVKMILNARFANAEFVRRFRTEAEAAARLHHPHIVAVYEVGTVDGQHYFSMEYIEGRDLGSLVREQPLPAKRAAQYVRTIAEAIHHAHQHGILHRDLKPSNVMLDAEGEVRVMDFGLAKQLEMDDLTPLTSPGGLTLSGQVLGSPNYMSPEQAAGNSRAVTVRSDVYALGAILYHLIAGRPPFMAETMEATLMQVLQLDAPPPRLLNPTVPRDLETISLKCLEKDPARRYGSARVMAEELTRFLNEEPVRARPITRPEKIWRWCKRHPLDAALGAATALLLCAVTGGSILAAVRIDTARRESVHNAFESRERLRRLNVATGIGAMESGDMLGALPWLVNALALEGTNSEAAGLARRRLGAVLAEAPQLEQVWSLGETVDAAEFSPNGRRLIVVAKQHTFFGREEDGWALVPFDATTNRIQRISFRPDSSRAVLLSRNFLHLVHGSSLRLAVAPVFFPRSLTDAQFSPDGRLLWVATGDGLVHQLDAATGVMARPPWRALERARWLAVSPDGTRLLVVGEDNAWLHDSAHGALLLPPIRHRDLINEARFSGDGRRIATASRDGTARISTALQGSWSGIRLPHPEQVWVMSAEFSPDNKLMATATDTGQARVWDAASGVPVTAPMHHAHSIRALHFSPDGNRIVTASFDHTARLWDARSGEPVLSALRHNGYVADAVFSADGARLVTAGQDGLVRVWQFGAGLLQWSEDYGTRVRGAVFNGDGSLVAAGAKDGTVKVWETATGILRGQDDQSGQINVSAFSPDGTMLVTGGRDGTTVLRSATNAAALLSPWQQHGDIRCVVFSPRSDRVVTASDDGTAQVWDTRTGRAVGERLSHQGAVRWAAFSPDGLKVATASDDATAQIWETETGRALGTPLAHEVNVVRVAFSPDGTKLATACSDDSFAARAAQLWEVASRQKIGPPMRHTDGVESIAFSPDGTRLATGSEDGVACVWSVATGQRLAPPMQHKYQVVFVQFVAEGRALFTAGKDGMVRLWDAATGEPLMPRVSHERNLSTAAVSGDGRHIACGTADGRLFVYSLPEETRPVPELVALSEQLTSRHLDPEAGLTPAPLDHLTNRPAAPASPHPQ